MLFIIARAEVPDLMSQMRLILEFTSEEIQDSSQGYMISEIFSLFFSTVSWMSQLDQKELSKDTRAYLIKANVEILRAEELLMKVRYDRIRIGREGSDRYNPFLLVDRRDDLRASVRNSYIDGETQRLLTKE